MTKFDRDLSQFFTKYMFIMYFVNKYYFFVEKPRCDIVYKWFVGGIMEVW